MKDAKRTGVEALAPEKAAEAAALAALCMADNSYYALLYQGYSRAEMISLMRVRIERTLAYCAAQKGLFGATVGGRLAAYEYMVDYRRLRDENGALFRAIFSYGEAAGETPPLREIKHTLSGLLDEGRRITYVLGCGVAPWARRCASVLAAMAHFNKGLLRSEDVIAADFSNRALLSLCSRHGPFEIKELSGDYWFFLRR